VRAAATPGVPGLARALHAAASAALTHGRRRRGGMAAACAGLLLLLLGVGHYARAARSERGVFHLGRGPFWLIRTYATAVLVTKLFEMIEGGNARAGYALVWASRETLWTRAVALDPLDSGSVNQLGLALQGAGRHAEVSLKRLPVLDESPWLQFTTSECQRL
jgi:hypothetical protein